MIASAVTTAGFLSTTDPQWKYALSKVRHDYFHLPAYLQASARHEGGEPLIFLLESDEFGMLVPLMKRPLSHFGRAFSGYCDVTSPYGYPSPLYWGEDWPSHLSEMHEILENFLRDEKVVSLFLRLNPFLGATDQQLTPFGTVQRHGPTVYMDLRDESRSWMEINSANRRFITKMLNRGYEVRLDEWHTLDTVIEAYYQTMERLEAAPYYFFPKEYFISLVQGTAPHLHLATSYTPTGKITGGVLFTETHGLMHYYLTGIFDDYYDISPGKLLINALRHWGIHRGHHTLHLGGGLGASKDGLFQFKARLSKSYATFSTFRKIILPDVYRSLCAIRGVQDGENDYFPIYRKPVNP